jgi:hypothetical protein
MKTKKHFETSNMWYVLAYITGFGSGVIVVMVIKLLSN